MHRLTLNYCYDLPQIALWRDFTGGSFTSKYILLFSDSSSCLRVWIKKTFIISRLWITTASRQPWWCETCLDFFLLYVHLASSEPRSIMKPPPWCTFTFQHRTHISVWEEIWSHSECLSSISGRRTWEWNVFIKKRGCSLVIVRRLFWTVSCSVKNPISFDIFL